MKRKKWLEEYFSFSKGSRLAILIMLLLLIFFLFLPRFLATNVSKKMSPADTTWIAAVKQLEIKDPTQGEDSFDQSNFYAYQYDRTKSYNEKQVNTSIFYFDPNTTSAEDWKKMGLREKTIKTIQTYLSKGGRFKAPEDLKKIYGLHNDEYERLLPFVRIKEGISVSETFGDKESKHFPEKHSYTTIDINTADTTAFISLPGIGSKLASRIINFRDKLGGFYSIEQIKETYGLPDSNFQKIKPYLKANSNAIKKININTATADELKAHPYIKYNIANPLIAYRKQHGPFEKIEDIKKVMVVTDEIYEKISAYLTIQ